MLDIRTVVISFIKIIVTLIYFEGRHIYKCRGTSDKSITSNPKKKSEKILKENLTNVNLKAKQLVILVITK
jgi:hypothetical protein